jgi:hypothetical protein
MSANLWEGVAFAFGYVFGKRIGAVWCFLTAFEAAPRSRLTIWPAAGFSLLGIAGSVLQLLSLFTGLNSQMPLCASHRDRCKGSDQKNRGKGIVVERESPWTLMLCRTSSIPVWNSIASPRLRAFRNPTIRNISVVSARVPRKLHMRLQKLRESDAE